MFPCLSENTLFAFPVDGLAAGLLKLLLPVFNVGSLLLPLGDGLLVAIPPGPLFTALVLNTSFRLLYKLLLPGLLLILPGRLLTLPILPGRLFPGRLLILPGRLMLMFGLLITILFPPPGRP